MNLNKLANVIQDIYAKAKLNLFSKPPHHLKSEYQDTFKSLNI